MVLAGAVALAAHRAGSLTRSGAAAATLAGALATAAGWGWAALLIAFFVSTSALSRAGAATTEERTGDVIAKPGARDWRQVAANGGVFLVAASAWLGGGGAWTLALGAGALAAAAADSWATEIGTLAGGAPRSILTLQPVPAGTSGGVSAAGTAALVAGAAFIAAAAWALGWPRDVAIAAAIGGAGGAMADSLIGATVQARRWCPACRTSTEQRRHRCGTPTERAGGVGWIDNDAVNLACTLAGGLLAVAAAA